MSSERPETLVIVERDTGIRTEIRQLVREGDKAFLIFARSDGSECRVEIDPAKIRSVAQKRIKVDFEYRGGVIKAPQQHVGP
jgi:hypothetical protein